MECGKCNKPLDETDTFKFCGKCVGLEMENGGVYLFKYNQLVEESKKETKLTKFLNNLNKRLLIISENQELLIQAIINKKQSSTLNRIEMVDKRKRKQILQRDNYRCKNCGLEKIDGKGLHIDHIHPRSEGGESNTENLQVLCRTCNLIKKNYIFESRGFGKNILIPINHTNLNNIKMKLNEKVGE